MLSCVLSVVIEVVFLHKKNSYFSGIHDFFFFKTLQSPLNFGLKVTCAPNQSVLLRFSDVPAQKKRRSVEANTLHAMIHVM